MRTFVSTLLLACVSLALVLSGPALCCNATSNSIMVELCVDGVVQVVQIGRDGQPVGPDKICDRAHACCLVAGTQTPKNDVPEPTTLFFNQTVPGIATAMLNPRIDLVSADPRGPPAVRIGQIDHMDIRS